MITVHRCVGPVVPKIQDNIEKPCFVFKFRNGARDIGRVCGWVFRISGFDGRKQFCSNPKYAENDERLCFPGSVGSVRTDSTDFVNFSGPFEDGFNNCSVFSVVVSYNNEIIIIIVYRFKIVEQIVNSYVNMHRRAHGYGLYGLCRTCGGFPTFSKILCFFIFSLIWNLLYICGQSKYF